MGWYEQFRAIFRIRELRNKMLFVLAVLGVFRVAAVIPVPGINTEELSAFLGGNQFFGFLNIFSGGALSNLSIVMLGLGPYITATITLQLLTMIFPKLKEMYEESGEEGKQKFNQYGRMFTVPLAALQGYTLIKLFQSQAILPNVSPLEMITILATVTAGAVWLMWLGELITEKGIGNGISLLIFAGIISSLPITLRNVVVSATPEDVPGYVLAFLVSLFIIAAVVVVNEAKRNIPISYAKQVRGNKIYGGATTYLPLSLNPAGVIPIIFALSLILFPGIIAGFLQGVQNELVQSIAAILNGFQNNIVAYSIVYFLMVVFFTYFYTAVTFNPETVSQNLQKQGGFIPGIRPGRPTAERLTFILNRTLLVGAVFLGGIAIVPSLAQIFAGGAAGAGSLSFVIGGTSVLIVVSVALDTIRQIKSQIVMRQYE
ncbi:MAG: preprotein translocase subunit SecY [Candidatus Spechtbacterales bacterium]